MVPITLCSGRQKLGTGHQKKNAAIDLAENLAPTAIVFVCSSPVLLYCLTISSLGDQQETAARVNIRYKGIYSALKVGVCGADSEFPPSVLAEGVQSSSLCSVLPWLFMC